METAIKREIKEELGIDVELFGNQIVTEDFGMKDGKKKHWITVGSFAKVV
ncbi:hypothetical protein KKH82_03035 [Patescibacteria group bacterium]|nr:hypothetical protein [Patescibacteria group bacterium]